MTRFSLIALALATGVYSQITSSKYVDAKSGISFAGAQVQDRITVGFASPEKAGSDIIGQIVSK